MRNFTPSQSKLFRLISLVLFLLFINYNATAQFFKKHYIAPAPWQYLSRANEIVIATNSPVAVKFTITTSKGDLVPLTKNGVTVDNTQLSTIKGAPAVYRFVGDPNTTALGYNLLGTVYDNRGLIVTTVDTGSGKDVVSVNLRNVASDAIGGGGDDKIKGNASLTSFGDAGIGVEFRVGYYRNVTSATSTDRPIYSVMAINDGTQVKLKGALLTTLKAGESYLFNADIGDLVESSGGPVVMNTGMRIDVPGGCGDGTFDQLPPVSVLGMEYFIERGKGNDTTEQTTVVATKPGTVLTISTFNATNGAEIGSPVTINLSNAGSFHTFKNGVSGNQFTSSRILASNNVAVYSGTGQTCEVDISTIAPVSACGGSNFVETSSFLGYTSNSLDYFGYVLLRSATDPVYLNSTTTTMETAYSLSRRPLGTTGWYIIDFERDKINNPATISINSNSKLTVSIAQQGNGYSMAAFFSNFAQQPSPPKETYAGVDGCLKKTATLTADPGFPPYEWRYNGVVIPGETSNILTVNKTGSYTVISTLSCGVSSQSTPIAVTLCSDVTVENKVNVSSQCVGANVIFTITAKNLGPSNAEGVSVTDKLPSGYDYVSSVASTGTSYNSSTGIWTISGLDSGANAVLTITAKVKESGSYITTATITSSNVDDPTGNNKATATLTANAVPAAPSVVVTAESCSAAASNILSVYNSALTYSSNPTGLSVGAGGVITGGTTGTSYTITATNSSSCSGTSANFVYNGKAQLAVPAAPSVVVTAESCSAAASNILSVYNSALTYSSNPTGLSVGAGGVITGGTTGTSYTITATNSSSCSGTSANFVYNGKAQLAVPAAPSVVVTAESCSAAASNILSVYNSALTYSSNPTG
ncbi:hypothetical protein, partial [Flavobacterium bizetiae]|uniref:hypothetical protein n=1 Tax=Flavobacterium bizetiae TaxID=2704140 RepID=UPI0037580BE6